MDIASELRQANRDCSGNEPSLSVLQRAADEAAAEIERLRAELDARDGEIAAWLRAKAIEAFKEPTWDRDAWGAGDAWERAADEIESGAYKGEIK